MTSASFGDTYTTVFRTFQNESRSRELKVALRLNQPALSGCRYSHRRSAETPSSSSSDTVQDSV